MLDFISGPLWKDIYDKENDELITGIDVIDNDKYIQELNDKIQDMYSSYYNSEDYSFDFKKEKEDKNEMLALLDRLINRANELNDGSFVIEDKETERIKNL